MYETFATATYKSQLNVGGFENSQNGMSIADKKTRYAKRAYIFWQFIYSGNSLNPNAQSNLTNLNATASYVPVVKSRLPKDSVNSQSSNWMDESVSRKSAYEWDIVIEKDMAD